MLIDDKTRVQHMVDAAEEAIEFARDKETDDLRKDRMLALALVKCLEVVGEAAFKTSRNYRDAHSEVPWKSLIELRNHLVHEYHDIDIERVLRTIGHNLPVILPTLQRLADEQS